MQRIQASYRDTGAEGAADLSQEERKSDFIHKERKASLSTKTETFSFVHCHTKILRDKKELKQLFTDLLLFLKLRK